MTKIKTNDQLQEGIAILRTIINCVYSIKIDSAEVVVSNRMKNLALESLNELINGNAERVALHIVVDGYKNGEFDEATEQNTNY